ncbi:MAG: DUF1854 domain-containing protein [Gemmatimonadaceae bacterium]
MDTQQTMQSMDARQDAETVAFTLRRGEDGRLLVVTGEDMVPVRLRLCYPWSEPRRHLSLRDDDDREVVLVADPAVLDPPSRKVLEQALNEAGFVLDITRVLDIAEEVEIRHWTVETRQGRRTFQTHLDDWPRQLPLGGLLIRDVAGDLYRLADPASLDRHSRQLLWAFVD